MSWVGKPIRVPGFRYFSLSSQADNSWLVAYWKPPRFRVRATRESSSLQCIALQDIHAAIACPVLFAAIFFSHWAKWCMISLPHPIWTDYPSFNTNECQHQWTRVNIWTTQTKLSAHTTLTSVSDAFIFERSQRDGKFFVILATAINASINMCQFS